MDGNRGYYDKWNMSGMEIQMPYGLTYIWILKIKQKNYKAKTDSYTQRPRGILVGREWKDRWKDEEKYN